MRWKKLNFTSSSLQSRRLGDRWLGRFDAWELRHDLRGEELHRAVRLLPRDVSDRHEDAHGSEAEVLAELLDLLGHGARAADEHVALPDELLVAHLGEGLGTALEHSTERAGRHVARRHDELDVHLQALVEQPFDGPPGLLQS